MTCRLPLRPLLLLLALAAACSRSTPVEQGEARPPGLRPTPERLAFLCVTPGCDTSEWVRVDVVGTRRVAIKRLLLSGEAAEDFSFAPSEQPPFILGENAGFDLQVRYLPRGAPLPGSVDLKVTYTDASADESDDRLPPGELVIPLLRRLVGEPVLAAAPAALSFGVVPPGTTATRALEVSNEGFGNIALELSEARADHPDLHAPLPELRALGPGQALELPVTFAPAGETYLRAELVLTATPSYVPRVKVQVEGTSLTTPKMAVVPTGDVDFGELRKGGLRKVPLQLANHGGQPLTVTSVEVVDSSGAVSVSGLSASPPFALGALERLGLELQLDGATAGEVDARVRLHSDDPQAPLLELRVRGTVTEPRLGLLPAAVDFGKVPVGWLVSEPVELRNKGYGRLTVKNIALVAGSSNLFTLSRLPALPLLLDREQRVAVDVGFRAETAATFNGWLSIETDDPVQAFVEVPIKAVAGSCLSACPIANGSASCSTGSCEVASCNAGWYDTDQQAFNGCECKEIGTDPGAFCANARHLGTFKDNDKTQASFTGLLPVKGDEDLIRFFAQDDWALTENFRVKVRLTSADPGIRFCIYRHDGGQNNECFWNNEACPSSRYYERGGSAGGNDDANYLVRVFRDPGSAPSCIPYTLFVSNGL